MSVKLLRFFEEDSMSIGCAASVAISFKRPVVDVVCIPNRRLVVDFCRIHLFCYFSLV